MGTMSLAGLGSLAARPLSAHTAAATDQAPPGAAPAASGVTRALARYVVEARAVDVPAAVRKEAQRTLLNWVGLSLIHI